MAKLGIIAWPPPPIRTRRLSLRLPEAKDRNGIIELFSSTKVGTYVGGARPLEELERKIPEVPDQRPGLFVADLDGEMIGIVTIDRRDPDRRGHVRPEGSEAELGYMFLPQAWGKGYATEAATAVLEWFTSTLPGEPVVMAIPTANIASVRIAEKLGFSEIERFEEYGAEQWFGVLESGNASR